jgi:hypothetical protein
MEALIPITMFISIAAVAILRPISTRLGGLLEAMKNEKNAGVRDPDDPDIARIRVLIEHMSQRLDLMEERMDFTERLLNGRRGARDDGLLRARESDSGGRDPDLSRSRDAGALRP